MENNAVMNEEVLESVAGGAAVNYDTHKYIAYVVKSGDCLSMIAKNHGCTSQILYEVNKAVVGPNPNLIQIGMVLRIPVL